MNREVSATVRSVGFLLLGLVPALGAGAQDLAGDSQRLRARAGEATAISIHPATGVARFVRLAPGSGTSLSPLAQGAPEAKADAFFREYAGLFGVGHVRTELKLVDKKTDTLGMTRLTYQQVYGGVPVFAGVLRAHFDRNGAMTVANGVFVPGIAVSRTPAVAAQAAGKTAVAHALRFNGERALTGAAPRVVSSDLMVFRTGLVAGRPGANHLAWKVEVGNGAEIRKDVFVDAASGKVLDSINRVEDALLRRAFDAEGQVDPGPNYPNAPFWSEGDAFPTGDVEADNMILASLETYNHYENAYSYDSGDLYPFFPVTNGEMHSIFNMNIPLGGCPNAFWNSTYIAFCPGTTTDDVTSHEWSHAITEFTSGLIYQWQSGALNESYSDVHGETVDLINGRGLDTPGGPRVAGQCSAFSTPNPTLTINAPPPIQGDYAAGAAAFGAPLDAVGITNEIVQVDDGDPSDPDGPPIPGYTDDACQPLINGAAVAGKIALIHRGNCTFVIKVKNAQNAGAIGAIVYNHFVGGDAVQAMGGNDPTITIPSLFVGQNVGMAMLAQMPGVNGTLHVNTQPTDNSYRWLIGEESSAFGEAIRDMSNPPCYSNPGKVTDATYYVCGGEVDGGGVHTNSGVPNHAYALLTDGGTYNGHTVAPIGMTKAAHLWFRAQSQYLVPASNFVDMADALEQSCVDLTGINLPSLSTATGGGGPSGEIIGAADCAALTEAIAAVEFRTIPAFCNFQPLLDTSPAPLCGAGDVAAPVFQETFEADPFLNGWTTSLGPVSPDFTTRYWTWATTIPDRPGAAAFAINPQYGACAPGQDESGVIQLTSPTITVPAAARVAFDLSIATEPAFDGANVKISVNGGPFNLLPTAAFTFNPYNLPAFDFNNPLEGEPGYSGTDDGSNVGAWGTVVADLNGIAAAGDQVQLRFDFGQDCGTGFVGIYLDNVKAYGCQAPGGTPSISIGDVAVAEGNTGLTGASFTVTLSPADPGAPHSVDFATADGTGTTANNDYQALAGTVVFAPNETIKSVTISVVGDITFENDEDFFVNLSNPTGGAVITDGSGEGFILNDDKPLAVDTRGELVHDSRETRDLGTISRFWRVSQKAHSSYEVIVDAVTGDLGAAGPDLLRLDSDGVSVLQAGTSATGGTSKSLRFENASAGSVDGQFIRVRSAGCTADCDATDTFRIRAYDTTYRMSRFNNSATQVTVVVIANPTGDPVTGTLWFYTASTGSLVAQQAVTIAPKATFVLSTAGIAPGAGSVTFSNDAAFGALTGKAVAVEPATGFTFDTAMVPRAASTKMIPRDN